VQFTQPSQSQQSVFLYPVTLHSVLRKDCSYSSFSRSYFCVPLECVYFGSSSLIKLLVSLSTGWMAQIRFLGCREFSLDYIHTTLRPATHRANLRSLQDHEANHSSPSTAYNNNNNNNNNNKVALPPLPPCPPFKSIYAHFLWHAHKWAQSLSSPQNVTMLYTNFSIFVLSFVYSLGALVLSST
jgi:hypothetical protein